MLKTINLIGAKISFDEINGHSSKTIVFVHGNSQSRSSFEHQLKDTAFCDYRLISLDLPGHGDSDSLSVYSIPIFSNYLSDFIQTMALDQYMLVGHSLGGHIVVETLNAISPAGILIAGASLVTKPIKAEAFHAHEMMPYLYQDDLSDEQILKLLSSFHQSKLPLESEIELLKKTDSKFRSCLGASLGQNAFQDEVLLWDAFKGPKAIVQGSADAFVNVDYLRSELVQSDLWQQQLVMLPGGHSIHQDNPRAFNYVLGQFAKYCFESNDTISTDKLPFPKVGINDIRE